MTIALNGHTAADSGTVTLGDLTVYRLGYGAMQITGDGVWGDPPDRDAAKEVLRRAVELGVNFIDTADAYGPNVSEELIGEALAPYSSDVVIATKGGLTRPNPGDWTPDGRPDHLREAVEGSLRRLQLEAIPLYQLHRPDPQVPFEESIGALAELRDAGKIQHVGLSNVSVEQLRSAQKIVPIVSVQNRYNLADRSAEAVLDECSAQGIAFLPWFPLATGNLAEEDGPLAEASRRHDNASPGQLALAWLLHRSPIMLPIPGTSSLAHLEENVAAASIELTDEEFEALSKAA